jgi:hypothetical protein
LLTLQPDYTPMLNLLKKLLLPLILTISVVVSPIYARLGDDEQAVVERNKENAYHTDEYKADEHFKVYVFQFTKGFYSIGVMDGKVEVETYGVWDEYSFPSDVLVTEMSSYSDKWDEIDSPIENTRTLASTDGEFFVVIGEMKPMKVKKSLTLFTKKFREYGRKMKI